MAQAIEAGHDHVDGEVLVKFRTGVSPQERQSALRAVRMTAASAESRWIGEVLHLQGDFDAEQAAFALRRQPEVEFAEPNDFIRQHSTPNDPSFSRQWNFDVVNVPSAWDINPGGKGDLLIAIVDSGLTTIEDQLTFPIYDGRGFIAIPVPFGRVADFDHSRVLPGTDYTFWPYVWDTAGHGTHVAGTIGQATNNNFGLAGIAYNARLLPLKACLGYWDWQLAFNVVGLPVILDPRLYGGQCPTDAWIAALRAAADAGANVINISLGGTNPNAAARDALVYAVQRGAFVSIAAGNNGNSGNLTNYPAAYAASIDGAMAVGAVDRTSTRTLYSAFGSYIEIAAPGGMGSDGAGSIWQLFPSEADSDWRLLRPRFDRYQEKGISGTSMAAPHVAAIAGLLYTQGLKSPATIEAALKQFARDLGLPGRDDEYGAGLVDARAALRGLGLSR